MQDSSDSTSEGFSIADPPRISLRPSGSVFGETPTKQEHDTTIDERLERLTERHEALAQSIELLTGHVHELSATVKQLSATVHETVGGMKDLAIIARSHETRISNLEN